MTVEKAVKDRGVIMDCNLSFKDQINQVVRTTGYHLRNISLLKKYLDGNTMKILVHNHVISKLDYCNLCYYELPNYLLKKLQLVMNRAARLIKDLAPHERIAPVLIDLHGLPIKECMIYKTVLTHQPLQFGKPRYIRNLLQDLHLDTPVAIRHNAEQHRLFEPRVNLKKGFRTFEKITP
ncbi:uncharacterized protein LOC143030271 [Oratosquilla oratoria]|uniref:uncharacterized protein LOC143030271 n=1 Tax=Oratosquilla oratoria TaxID=337810 RepID=UPI003F77335C